MPRKTRTSKKFTEQKRGFSREMRRQKARKLPDGKEDKEKKISKQKGVAFSEKKNIFLISMQNLKAKKESWN